MRELTFKGFLREYVKELSFCHSTNLTKLTNELQRNPRLREPLILYSVFYDKQFILKEKLKDDHEYLTLISKYQKEELINQLNNNSEDLSTDFIKVWKSYLSERHKPQSINHTKELIMRKVNDYKKIKNITNYRIYTDLKLNHGNINSWLKNGECDKVSLETARRVLKYTEELKV